VAAARGAASDARVRPRAPALTGSPAQEQVLHVPVGTGVHPRPVSQPAAGGHEAGVAHELVPTHLTSQLHDEPQVTPSSQLPVPLHVTVHGPAPHVTSSQELLPLHVTSQLAASEQSMIRQSSALSQMNLQAMPVGHSRAALRHRFPVQSIVQSA
jgi:hypothetical protein